MKVLVTGDLHIKLQYIEEQKKVNQFILNTIQNEKIGAICIAGDIFDSYNPHILEVKEVIKFFASIPEEVKVYVIAGNHEEIKRGSTALDWVTFVRTHIVYHPTLLEFNINNKRFLMKHCNLEESKVGPNCINLPGGSVRDFTNYDVVILGHIHKSQILKESPLIFHPGSPIYLNFGERNDEKVIYLLNVTNNKVSYKTVATPAISMHQFVLTEPFDDSVLNKLSKESKVKITFKGNTPSIKNLQRIYKIVRYCKQKFKEFKYEVVVDNPTKLNKTIDKTLNIEKLLKEFFTQEKVDPNIQKIMSQYILSNHEISLH